MLSGTRGGVRGNRLGKGAWALALTLVASAPRAGATDPDPPLRSPEMARLARAFLGEWTMEETMERSPLFPEGAARHGMATFRLGTLGTTLVEEGHSDGTAGPLSFLIVFWWDQESKAYKLFTCFKARGQGCEVRGAAHWEGEEFVNDYDDEVAGKRVPFRDSFSHMTPLTFTLVESMAAEGGWRPLITTSYRRRPPL